MTTLQNSYCVPKTEDEWRNVIPAAIGKVSFGAVWFTNGSLHNINQKQLEYGGQTEIPVQHFLDLLHDRIVPWRLEEIGCDELYDSYAVLVNGSLTVPSIYVMKKDMSVCFSVFAEEDGRYELVPLNITTFASLLQLIQFLTPTEK